MSKSQQQGKFIFYLIIIGAAIFLVSAIIEFFKKNPNVLYIIIAILVCMIMIVVLNKIRIDKSKKDFISILKKFMASTHKKYSDEDVNNIIKLKKIINKKLGSDEFTSNNLKNTFINYINMCTESGQIDEIKSANISILEDIIELTSFTKSIKKDKINDFIKKSIEDNYISKEERDYFVNLTRGLNFHDDELKFEIGIVNDIIESQNLHWPLEPCSPPDLKLKTNEVTYYVSSGTVLARRKIRGTDEYDFEEKISGPLIITDKRIMVIKIGTTQIKINDILDISVDIYWPMIIITKQNAQTPIFIETQRPVYTAKILQLIIQNSIE